MPLVKLGYLLIRTIAKPISNGIKSYAQNHPGFRAWCIKVAQGYHRSEVRLRRGLQSRRLRQKASSDCSVEKEYSPLLVNVDPEIKPLDPQKAVETGSNFLGELVVFSVASLLLVADQLSSRQREANRRVELEERLKRIETSLQEATAAKSKP